MPSKYRLVALYSLLRREMERLEDREKAAFVNLLNREGILCRDRRIPRIALQDPTNSAWEHLLQS